MSDRHEQDIVRRDAFQIPDVLAPVGTKCITLQIPDDEQWEATFFACLTLLTKWNSYDRDDAHSATVVASVWRELLWSTYGACAMFDIRLNPVDFCTIQLTTDGGLTWLDKADLSACAHAAAVDEIDQRVSDGNLSGGSQQPGQGSGTPGQCYDYYLTLQGNNRWLAPIAVGEGDTIAVDSESGGWTDGAGLIPFWFCPDGNKFNLGQCSGGAFTQGTDPVPTVDHMRLIGNLPNDTTTPFFDIYETSYTVPAGVAAGDFFIQANDDQLADNQGSVNFHVRICKNIWTHCWLGGHGQGALVVPVTLFGHTAGTYNSGADAVDSTVINMFGDSWAPGELDFSGHIIDVRFTFDYNNSDPVTAYGVYVDGVTLMEIPVPVGSGTLSLHWTGMATVATKLQFIASGLPSCQLKSIQVQGTDAIPPFGADNC